MNCYGFTDIGNIRQNNEDSFIIKELGKNLIAAVVADGMGGHKGGMEASSFASSEIMNTIEKNYESFIKYTDIQKQKFLKNAVVKVNKALYKKSKEDQTLSGMGTTLVVCIIYNNSYYVANVGDSRLYVISDDIKQITKDHSFVNELLDMGAISIEQAENHPNKNVITRAVGTEESVEADTYTGSINKKDAILICTDGLTNMVDDNTILTVVKDIKSPQKVTENLVMLAKENGGTDNITAVVIKASTGGEEKK